MCLKQENAKRRVKPNPRQSAKFKLHGSNLAPLKFKFYSNSLPRKSVFIGFVAD
ncbi:hypothetical protein CSUNSWCD_119 [Campylobacter showae CSUNSWCD]|uniref:Uncharacterized protein n=1 Tax=Campylobacter showae CSUNSWCD TaxID=1244083 RepID=M5IRM4_9BACT|nr:hypothetical protein CSUNSWCD_119 [Campylobacter showae CSUNSWCD]